MLRAADSHFTDFFTPTFAFPAKPKPLFRLPYVYSRVSSTAVGRRDSTSPEKHFPHSSAADMNEDLNPQAMPFRPGGPSNDPRHWNRSRNENLPPHMPPFGHPGAPWHMGFPPPPPPPPQFFSGNQFPYTDFEAHQQAQTHEQARAYHQQSHHQPQHHQHQQWPQNFGPPMHQGSFQPPPPPYGQPPMYPQQHFPPHFPPHPPHFQQQRGPPPPPPRQPGFPPHTAHFQAIQQASWPNGASNKEIQYAFNALIKGLKSKNRGANSCDRAPTQTSKKSKKSKVAKKAAANGEDAQDIPQPAKAPKKGKYGDEKIMLPAPQPTDLYMNQAAEEPSATASPAQLLVILDLNGTVLFRPNRNAKTMIARPYLTPFLRYLFQNFKVMVWSSAKPATVKSLVEQSLDKDLKSMLIASWARDTFGLSATNFNQNVQVYKNLRLIWSRDQIQQHHPEYEAGKRFGQHNTVLIDDSALKASAQPHNLLEIPEFEATPEQMEGDMLREVAGYLEILRQQADVSKFISKQPFKGDGRWSYDWPAESMACGGEMKEKISMKGKTQGTKTKTPRTSTPRAGTPRAGTPKGSTLKPPITDVTSSLSSVSLNVEQQRA